MQARHAPLFAKCLFAVLTVSTARSDPSLQEIAKLLPSNGGAYDQFGVSAGLDGDHAVVGAIGIANYTGGAYIFARNQGGPEHWGQVAELSASDSHEHDAIGYRVAISGDTVVLGNLMPPGRTGAAYIFERDWGGPNHWGQVKKLTASDAAPGDGFGFSVAVSEDIIVIGATRAQGRGAAYIFGRNQDGPNQWGEMKKIVASDGAAEDIFGHHVAISIDTLVVGAPWDDDAGGQSGSAYVFQRDYGGADNWGQVAKITASDSAAGDFFGVYVAISTDTVLVGAYGDDNAHGTDAGAAYVFGRHQGGPNQWGEVTKIVAADGAAGDIFGAAVALDGNRAVVGSLWDDIGGFVNAGSAYAYDRDSGGPDNWGQVAKLVASDGAAEDRFGRWVAIDGDSVLVAADLDNDLGTDSGSAYVFSSAVARVRGDLNCDGAVNFSDINPFVLVLSDITAWRLAYPGCPFRNGDCNGDGWVDFGDINPFVVILGGADL